MAGSWKKANSKAPTVSSGQRVVQSRARTPENQNLNKDIIGNNSDKIINESNSKNNDNEVQTVRKKYGLQKNSGQESLSKLEKAQIASSYLQTEPVESRPSPNKKRVESSNKRRNIGSKAEGKFFVEQAPSGGSSSLKDSKES